MCPPDHWKLVLDSEVSKIKSLLFFPVFHTNESLAKSSKKLKVVQVEDSPMATKCMYDTWSAIISKKQSKFKIYIWPIYGQTDIETGILIRRTKRAASNKLLSQSHYTLFVR